MTKEERKALRINQGNTPKFWKRVRNWSLLVATIGGAVMTGGAALPAVVLTIATILTSAATTAAAVAALTKEKENV
jgi:hypothetical protein